MPSALSERLTLHSSKQIIPPFIYGTAWKKDRTAELVYQALCSGFTGIGTAAQPRHYREDLVGEGIRQATSEGKVSWEDLFVCCSISHGRMEIDRKGSRLICVDSNQIHNHQRPRPGQLAL